MNLSDLIWLTEADWSDAEVFLRAFAIKLNDIANSNALIDRAQGCLETIACTIDLYCDHGSSDSLHQFLLDLDSLFDTLLSDISTEVKSGATIYAQQAVIEDRKEK